MNDINRGAPAPERANFWTETFLAMDSLVLHPADPYFGFLLRGAGPVPGLPSLRDQIARRLPALPGLTRRPSTTRQGIVWTPDETFDIDRHVQACPKLDEDLNPAQQLIPDTGSERPLWGLWLNTTSRNGSWEIYYLAHHALQDATGAIHTLRTFLDADSPGLAEPQPAARTRPPLPRILRAAACLGSQVVSSYFPTAEWEPLTHPPGRQRRYAHAQVPAGTLRTLADRHGASVTQVHLAAMTSALRRLETDTNAPAKHRRRPLHVCLPLDTRQPSDLAQAVGNRLGLFRAPLPRHQTQPIRQIQTITRTISRSRVQRHRLAWQDALAVAPRPLLDYLHRRITYPANTKLTISAMNVPGTLTFNGAAVTELIPLPWLPPGHACFTLLATYRDATTLSVLTNGTAVAPERLAKLWMEAIDDLEAA
jgi:hypothetical protein